MTNIEKRLRELIDSRLVVVIGLGNPDRADDGVGIEVARQLRGLAPERIFSETEGLEGIVLRILDRKDAEVGIFIDAVDFGGRPGEVRIFSDADFPPCTTSTHKVPLGLLSALLKKEEKASYLVGIQPGTLDFDSEISDEVHRSLGEIVAILSPFFHPPREACSQPQAAAKE